MTLHHVPMTVAASQKTPGALVNAQQPAFDEQARTYFYVLRSYKRLIALVTAAFVTVAIGYLCFVTPEYSASTTLRVGVYRSVLKGVEEGIQDVNAGEQYLDTQIQELQSLSLADRVLADPEILASIRTEVRQEASLVSAFLSDEGVKSSAYRHSLKELQVYLRKIQISPIRKTSLIVIKAVDSNPETAARIANTHAKEYIAWTQAIRIKEQRRGLAFLREQEKELRASTEALERELTSYAEDNALITLSEKEHSVVKALEQLQEQHQKVTVERIRLEKQYEELTASAAGKSLFDDQSMQRLREELAGKKAELRQLEAKFKPEYPRVKQLSSQVKGLEEAISSHYDLLAGGASARLQALRAEEQELGEELERKKSIAFEVARKQVRYNIVQRELESTEQLLEHVLREMKQTSMAAESNASHLSMVDPALVPHLPSAPRKKLILILSVVSGLMTGMAMAFLLRSFDESVRSTEELAAITGSPSLGLIPHFEIEAVAAIDMSHQEQITPALVSAPLPVFIREPLSLASESFRTVRTNILISQAGTPPRTLLVTSAQAGEGKTTVAVNLASALAGTGAEVIIVDADLRRPRVPGHFGCGVLSDSGPGIVEILTGHATIESAILKNVATRVSVLPAGTIPPNPAELLGSLEMASVLDHLSRAYDYVVIDSPPVLPVADALVLSQIVDGTLIVAQAGETSARFIKESSQRLYNVGARVLGSVLNDVNLSKDEYYYYQQYYRGGYGYFDKRGGKESETEAGRDLAGGY